jgi:hypothetical protein
LAWLVIVRCAFLLCCAGEQYDFVEVVQRYQHKHRRLNTNKGELAAFIAYAQAYPEGFLALGNVQPIARFEWSC